MGFQRDIQRPGIGGINLDVVDVLLKNGATRLVRNARRHEGEDGLDGSLRNIPGNKLIEHPGASSGGTVIGTAMDTENNAIIYFELINFSSGISRYYPETEVIETILDYAGLNFSVNHRINDAFIVDGLLYWNDAYNPPRKINIKRAYNYSNDLPDGYKSIDEQTINLIKAPPLHTIRPYYITDETRMMNSMRGILFQFRTAYIYDDDERSRTSPISTLTIPIGEIDHSGEIIGDLQLNNCIAFNIPTGHHTVKKIIIYVREGSIGVWNELEIIDKEKLNLSDDFHYQYKFYNDRTIVAVDQKAVERLYDAVPFKADRMTYLHTNNILLGGNDEGFENINDISVNFEWEANRVFSIIGLEQIKTYPDEPHIFISSDPPDEGQYWFIGTLIRELTPDNLPELYNIIKIFQPPDQLLVDFYATIIMISDAEAFKDALINILHDTLGGDWLCTKSLMVNGVQLVPDDAIYIYQKIKYKDLEPDQPIDPLDFLVREWSVKEGSYRSFPSWKSGTEHKFGLIYYDEYGRSSFVQNAGRIYIPFITELNANYQNYKFSILWEINHRPPDWAVKYQWCRQKNVSISFFRRYIVDGIYHGITENEDPDAPSEDKSIIDISPLNRHKIQYNGFDYSFPNSTIEPYIWEKGDRVRFITKERSEFDTEIEGLNWIVDYYLDMEILGYQVNAPDNEGEGTEDAIPMNVLIIQRINTNDYKGLGENSLIEIYRPKRKQEDAIYYEMGGVYDVINDPFLSEHKLHSGQNTHQKSDEAGNIINPAKGEFTKGDVYIVPTLFSKKLTVSADDYHVSMIESASVSNFYDLQVYDIGRVNIENKNAERKKHLNLRLSERYFENTEINGLSNFEGANDVFLSAEFGQDITGLREVGWVLKAIQQNKRTSFYIGKTGIQTAGDTGQEIVASSGNILDNASPSFESYGCRNPESIIVLGKHLFFVDIDNGAIIRDAKNGMYDIATYGIKGEITNICKDLQKFTYNLILASFNPKTNEVGFTFIGIDEGFNSSQNFGTYYFKDKTNEWTCVFDFVDDKGNSPEAFAYINKNYVSFIQRAVYHHEVGSEYNVFYGKKAQASVELIFTDQELLPKLYRVLELTGKGGWGSPDIGDIKINAEYSVTEKEQVSRLLPGRFKNTLGKLVAYFLKDGGLVMANQQNKLRNGKELRGFIIKIKLVNNDTTLAYINTVSVLYQPLELSQNLKK